MLQALLSSTRRHKTDVSGLILRPRCEMRRDSVVRALTSVSVGICANSGIQAPVNSADLVVYAPRGLPLGTWGRCGEAAGESVPPRRPVETCRHLLERVLLCNIGQTRFVEELTLCRTFEKPRVRLRLRHATVRVNDALP